MKQGPSSDPAVSAPPLGPHRAAVLHAGSTSLTTKLTVVGPQTDRLSNIDVLEHQMSSPVFLVRSEELPCALETREVMAGDVLELGGARIRREGQPPRRSLAPHRLRGAERGVRDRHRALFVCRLRAAVLALGADVLIHDSHCPPRSTAASARPIEGGLGSLDLRRRRWAGSTPRTSYSTCRSTTTQRRNDEQGGAPERLAQSLFAGSVAAREGTVDRAPGARGGCVIALPLAGLGGRSPSGMLAATPLSMSRLCSSTWRRSSGARSISTPCSPRPASAWPSLCGPTAPASGWSTPSAAICHPRGASCPRCLSSGSRWGRARRASGRAHRRDGARDEAASDPR